MSSTEKIFVKENLTQLNKSYYSDYNNLKEKLGFNDEDFALIVYYDNKNITMTRTKPQVIVNAIQFPIKIMNESGDIIEGYVNLQVW